MDTTDIKNVLEMDIKKSAVELKAKKILLKRLKKGAKTSFIETKPGRAVNHVLAFVTYPFARVHHDARMRLDSPKTYRAEVALRKAEKLAKECEETSSSAGKKAARLALRAALTDTILMEFESIPELEDRVRAVRAVLAREGKRLGISVVEAGEGMGIDDLLGSLGMKGAGQSA